VSNSTTTSPGRCYGMEIVTSTDTFSSRDITEHGVS
jgi:hypothetical protein